MMYRASWMATALAALLAFGLAEAQEKRPLNNEVVIGVLTEAFPDLEADSIKVKLLKRLTSRAKVNLEIGGRNAILYLTWKRGQGGSRWWFEIDERRSLVYLSKTTKSARTTPTRSIRKVDTTSAAEAKPDELARTETIEVNVDALKPTEVKEEPAAEPAEAKPGEKETEPEVKPVDEEAKPTEVEKEAEPVEETAPDVEPQPAEEPVRVEPEEKPAAKGAEPEVQPVASEPEFEEAVEEAPEVEAEPGVAEIASGAVEDVVVPLAAAVGPGASNRAFLTQLVSAVARGSETDYKKFLLRSDEIAERISPERFNRLQGLWGEQCGAVHAELKQVGKVEVKRITLQRARDGETEQATIERLRRTVPTVIEIFTSVRIDLLLDGQPAYIDIGGLMRIETGWRVGGRMSFARGLEPSR